jgi:molecular chaperone DnaK
MSGVTIGIDLGTTNCAAAYIKDGSPTMIPIDGALLLPSVVGVDEGGALVVGTPARNQWALHPERTVRSVKRSMGTDRTFTLGEQTLTPEEVSALLLTRVVQAARAHLGREIESAVITVPAYFSDAQRSATRRAGEIAGIRVARIVNEPTAAALAFAAANRAQDRKVLVYDLGGGTFDVSIVRISEAVTEVMASHGDTQLGGDDFDERIAELLLDRLHEDDESGDEDDEDDVTDEDDEGTEDEARRAKLAGDPRLAARLAVIAERAKIALSTESYVPILEESLSRRPDGTLRHLDLELARHDYEALIAPLLQRTVDSVSTALRQAGVLARDLDDVLLVGGSSRTPRVTDLLHGALGRMPRADVDPDLAVAMGAAIVAERAAGRDAGPVLVDITPYSFGTSYLGTLDGFESPDCYQVIIARNSPIPTRKTEVFYTENRGQAAIEVEIFQGEAKDARDNLLIGSFHVTDLDQNAPANSPIHFELALDLDGILEVKVTEKHTGMSKGITIENAFRQPTPEELAASRARLESLVTTGDAAQAEGAIQSGDGGGAGDGPASDDDLSSADAAAQRAALATLGEAERLLPTVAEVDAAELREVVAEVRRLLEARDFSAAGARAAELDDMLFYLQ